MDKKTQRKRSRHAPLLLLHSDKKLKRNIKRTTMKLSDLLQVDIQSDKERYSINPVKRTKIDPPGPATAKARVDGYLSAVANLYYRHPDVFTTNESKLSKKDQINNDIDPVSEFLDDPRRQSHVLDSWAPYDIAMFEEGMCCHGKDFFKIHELLETKTVSECVDFYYQWKKSSHYHIWKSLNKVTAGLPGNKRNEQLKRILNT